MSLLRLARCTLDLDRRRLFRDDGTEEVLGDLDASLLQYLVDHADTVVTYDDLLVSVWGFRAAHPRGVVQTAFSRLRAMIGDDPKAPDHLFTVRGTGYRFTLPRSDAALAPAGLPRPGTPFLGRADDLAGVRDLVAAGEGLVVVLGLGGAGKTRLALEVTTAHPGRAWFADLTDATDLDGLCAAVAAALGVALDPAAEGEVAVDRISRALAPGLLVLDNLEQVVDAASPALAAWRAAAPDTVLLVTSRRPTGLPGEVRWPLGPLSTEDAVALLLDRARRAEPRFTADPEVLEALVGLVDRLPLAIELLAARANVLSPAEMQARLDQRFALLRRRGEGRHDNLEAVLRWSWEELSGPARSVLSQLSVFRGGFTATAAEAVVSLPGSEDFLAVLADLFDHSWLSRPAGRLHLLETLRVFAEGERDAACADRHVAWAVGMVQDALADLDGGGLETLAAERANLLAAREHAVTADPGAAAVLAGGEIALARGRGGALAPLGTALDAVLGALGDHPVRPEILMSRADVAADLGHAEAAEARLDEAEAGGERADAQLLRGWLAVTFHAAPDAHRLERAEAHYRKALALFEAAGDRVGAFRARYRLGATDLVAGRFEEGLRSLRALVHEAPPDVPRDVTTAVWIAMARCQARLGRLDEALASFEQAGTVLGDDTHRLAPHYLRGAAAVRAQRGELDAAKQGYDRVLELYRRYDDRRGEAHLLNDLAELERQRGDLDAAERGYHQALRLHRALGTLAHGPRVNLALVALERGRSDDARALLDVLMGESLEPYLELVARALSLVPAADSDAWDDHLAAVEDLYARTRFVHPDLARAFRLAATRARRPERAAAAWRLAAEQYERLGDHEAASEALAARSGG